MYVFVSSANCFKIVTLTKRDAFNEEMQGMIAMTLLANNRCCMLSQNEKEQVQSEIVSGVSGMCYHCYKKLQEDASTSNQ